MNLESVTIFGQIIEGTAMGYSDQFFKALGLDPSDKKGMAVLSKKVGIPIDRLKYFNTNNVVPTGKHLEALIAVTGVSEVELMVRMGRLNKDVLEAIQENADRILDAIKEHKPSIESPLTAPQMTFKTRLGTLYEGDCVALARTLESDSVDLVFADPPFNLNKLYPSKINDSLKTEKYIHWCQEWLSECIRILKPGGSLFLWNLPVWNAALSTFLEGRLTFKHWISVDMKFSLPIPKRLYPSHYSLLYYVKGPTPNTFHPDRLPTQTCPHCYGDLKDYGGYKNKMNPLGVNMTDVWLDIAPVRHAKFKRRNGANELSLKLLDRVIEMASDVGDTIFDPFGGSGTTYVAAELKERQWIGCEIGPSDDIVNRFSKLNDEAGILQEYRNKLNALFPEDVKKKREIAGLWTCETVTVEHKDKQRELELEAIEAKRC